MEEAPLPPQSFSTSRQLPGHQYSTYPNHHHQSTGQLHQLETGISSLEGGDVFQTTFTSHLAEPSGHQLPLGHPFARDGGSLAHAHHPASLPAAAAATRTHRQHQQQPLHGISLPQPHQQNLPEPRQQQSLPSASQSRRVISQSPQSGLHLTHLANGFVAGHAYQRLQQDATSEDIPEKDGSHFSGMKMIQHPPELEKWRQRLFHVEEPITLTEEEFQTYFPHIDNVYSHRSTQRYKRKPFISHYWDCRLKGRPPGTPKSDDPNKKKRKRQARERDLCDVKIKITEYFPEAHSTRGQVADSGGTIYPTDDFEGASVCVGQRYYTISRVNGSAALGKGDVAAAHKHTIEESDRIKKSSVQRQFLKDEKEKKKVQRIYHKKATGAALQTVRKHSKEHDLKLYGSCFCPFVQRVWISLEHKSLSYQYIEIDPYKKPMALLAVNPLGLIPAIQHGAFTCHESTVLLEYIEDAFTDSPLLPPSPQGRARARLWADHVNRQLIPSFDRTLQAQEADSQIKHAEELKSHLQKLVEAADPQGPFFDGPRIGWVDVQLAPWLLRLSRVLGPYRGWPEPEKGSRWSKLVKAIENDASVKATTSGNDLYKDSYERYAENRPGTSQVADAVNSSRGLP